MFTNQNQSSGKFWVSAFIVGLLIFLGQFANSAETIDSCIRKYVNASTPCATLVRGQCQAGVQTCAQERCNDGYLSKFGYTGYYYEPSKGRGAACIPKQQQQAQENPNCNGSDVKFYPAAGGEPGEGNCICIATNQPAVEGKCKGEDVAELKTACEAVSGKFNPSDKSCNCGGEVFFGKISPNEVCGPKKEIASEQDWCVQAGGGYGLDDSFPQNACVCPNSDRSKIYVISNGQKCEKAAAATGKAPYNDRLNAVLERCQHTAMQARLDECVDGSEKAVDKCDAEAIKSANNAKQLGGVMKLLGTVQGNKAVEHADPDACGTAAYMGSAATLAIDAFKKTCDDQVKECKDKCQALKEGESFAKLRQNCEQAYNQEFSDELGPAQAATGRQTIADRINQQQLDRALKTGKAPNISNHEDAKVAIRADIAEMEKKAKDNLVKCESDAVKGEADIGNYLAEILTSSMAAAQCRNLASNSAVRCAKLAPQLTPQYCQVNPSEICCAPYIGSTVDCNGKDYSSKQCVCARSPDSSGCKTVVSTPPPTLTNPGGVANLAAPGGIKAGNQYKPSGTVGGGGFEVGNDMDPSKPTGAPATGGSTNPFGVASGGGGGGGGGVPNSPNDGSAPAPAAAEGAGSGLVGGAFNQLKTLADRMFGNGPGNSNGKNFGNGTGKDGKKNGTDNNGKPGLRGVAGGSSVFGPRNKDIWKIMNVQYGIQNHTFITNEK